MPDKSIASVDYTINDNQNQIDPKLLEGIVWDEPIFLDSHVVVGVNVIYPPKEGLDGSVSVSI